MSTKWENFLKNQGEWWGSFTKISLEGEVLESTPTILNLEVFDGQKAVQFRLRRFGQGNYDSAPTQDDQQEYRSLGRQVIFFETGAFSKGSLQVAPFTQFGAEYGFVFADRRLRFVQLYNDQGDFDSLTLIREFRSGTNATERPPLTLDQLIGHWEGEACAIAPDWQEPNLSPSQTTFKKVDEKHLSLQSMYGDHQQSLTGKIEDTLIHFQDEVPKQMNLLPDGSSIISPLKVSHRQSFSVEAGC